MEETLLLPPIAAVRIVWACTGTFSKDKDLRLSTFLIDKAMKDIKSLLKNKENNSKGKKGKNSENDNRIEKEKIEKEKQYLTRAMIAMNSCLRSMHTMYKGRDLNFEENTKLREAYLKSLEENIDFGNRLRDFLKSLPTMTIGGGSGAFLSQSIKDSLIGAGRLPGGFDLEEVSLWILVALGLAVGYFFNDLLVRWSRKRKQMLYIINDYERNIYYDYYIERVEALLGSLYTDLNQIYEEIFHPPYDKRDGGESEKEKRKNTHNMIKDLIGARPIRCVYINKHMREKKITPGKWAICETGLKKDRERCIHWRYEVTVNREKSRKSEESRRGKEKSGGSEENRISDENEMTQRGKKDSTRKIRTWSWKFWYRGKTWLGKFWYLRLDY